MPADLWTDAVRIAGCGLAAAVVALPIGLAARVVARRSGTPLLPRPKPWRVPWTWFEVAVAFVVLGPFLFPPLAAAALARSGFYAALGLPTGPGEVDPDGQSAAVVVRALWANLAAFPVQLGVILWATTALYPNRPRPVALPPVAARVGLALLAGVVLTVVVHAAHMAVNLAFAGLGWEPGQHALLRVAGRPPLDRALFAFEACVRAPVVEELFFRGVLLPWLLGRRGRTAAALVAVVAVAGLSGLVRANAAGDPSLAVGPVGFAAALAGGWLAVGRVFRRKRRSTGAVYASAALFAAVHSAVWPSPLPLFLLGLGLGWLALRTRGVMAPIVVHGLFNAVSVLYVLT